MVRKFFLTVNLILVMLLAAGCRPGAMTTTALPLNTTTAPPTGTPLPLTAEHTTDPHQAWASDLALSLDKWASSDEFSGAVLVAQGDVILLEDAYGLADRLQNIANQIDTRFNLGSMNKMFTSVAVMQLVEAGKLALDDTIAEKLPDYPNDEVAAQVTIHQLLTHTSGLGDVFTDVFAENPQGYRSNADYLPLFVNEPLLFEPGDQWSYSNAGYVVLGLIIEQVSGLGYDDYVQQNIFDPSGMLDTGAFDTESGAPGMAVGYTTKDFYGNETGVLNSNTALMPGRGFAAGGGYSTVEDLLHFQQALLGYKLISPEATELLLEGKAEIRENLSYAYGFMEQFIAGQRVVGHTGGAPGICSFLDMYPEIGITIVVLSNTDSGCVLVLDYLKNKPLK